MRRHVLGVAAIVLLAIAAWLTLTHWGVTMTPALTDLQAASFRMGVLLAVVWLAYDRLRRIPVWIGAGCLGSMVVVALWPRRAFVLVPVVFAAALLGWLGQRKRRA